VVQRGQERWLALRQRQLAPGTGVDHEADIGPYVVHHAVGLEDEVGATTEVGPQLVQQRSKLGLIGALLVWGRDEKGARRTGSEIAGGVSVFTGQFIFPDRWIFAMLVRGDFDGVPAELGERGDKPADQRGFACALGASADDDDGHAASPNS